MDILAMIDRATELLGEGFNIYNQVTSHVKSDQSVDGDTLQQAQDRLAAAMQRAEAAHDGLKNAIAVRLGNLDE